MLNGKVSGLCLLGSAGFEDDVKRRTRGVGVAAVFYPRGGGSTEEAVFRGCMAGGARWVRMSFLHLQGLETGFWVFFLRTELQHSHGVRVVLIVDFSVMSLSSILGERLCTSEPAGKMTTGHVAVCENMNS